MNIIHKKGKCIRNNIQTGSLLPDASHTSIVVITICSLKRVSTSSVLQQNFTNTQDLLSQPTLLLVVSIEFAVFD